MLTKAPRGTKDILPDKVGNWLYLENLIRKLCGQYGYREIRTPIFEHTELFQRGIGETTDVVEKEMYTFTDRGNRSITLRPENTAAAVRSYLENKLYADTTLCKLFYIGSMFRYDRPQAGRYREFHQFGVEALGEANPAVDAEIISLAVQFLPASSPVRSLRSVTWLRRALIPFSIPFCTSCCVMVISASACCGTVIEWHARRASPPSC